MQYYHVEDIYAFNAISQQIAQFVIARNNRNVFELLYNSKTGHPMILIADFEYNSHKYYTFTNKDITVGDALDTLGLGRHISEIHSSDSRIEYDGDVDNGIDSLIDLPILNVPLCQFTVKPRRYRHSTMNIFQAVIAIKKFINKFVNKYVQVSHSECGICYEEKMAFALHDDNRHTLCYKCKANVMRSGCPSCPFCRKRIVCLGSSDTFDDGDDPRAYYNDMYDNSYINRSVS